MVGGIDTLTDGIGVVFYNVLLELRIVDHVVLCISAYSHVGRGTRVIFQVLEQVFSELVLACTSSERVEVGGFDTEAGEGRRDNVGRAGSWLCGEGQRNNILSGGEGTKARVPRPKDGRGPFPTSTRRNRLYKKNVGDSRHNNTKEKENGYEEMLPTKLELVVAMDRASLGKSRKVRVQAKLGNLDGRWLEEVGARRCA